MTPDSQAIVAKLTSLLVQSAHPKRIILFGSQTRLDADESSDFDVMVVEEKPVTVSLRWSA